MSHDCIFCRIVRGEIPSARVYEDADVMAFMDISPVVKGHTLVIPKGHHNRITDAPVEALQKVIAVVQRIAAAQVAGLRADGISISQVNGPIAGQVVPHVHFHVIPRFGPDGQHGHWTPGQYSGPAEMSQFAERIRAAL